MGTGRDIARTVALIGCLGGGAVCAGSLYDVTIINNNVGLIEKKKAAALVDGRSVGVYNERLVQLGKMKREAYRMAAYSALAGAAFANGRRILRKRGR